MRTWIVVLAGSLPTSLGNPMPNLHVLTRRVLLAAVTLLVSCGDGGGGTGSSENPLPSVSGLEPASVPQASLDTTFDVLGQGFVAGVQVQVQGVTRASTTLSSARIRVTVPASLFATPGALAVQVTNPPPGGGTVDGGTFTVTPEVVVPPTLTSLAPAHLDVGATGATVVLTGTGFSPASLVRFDTLHVAVTYTSPTQLTVVVPDALLLAPDTLQVMVENPTSASQPMAFEVRAGVPVLSAIAPAHVGAGSPDVTLSISGTGFTPTTAVRLDATTIAGVTVHSPAQLSVVVPAALLTTPHGYGVVVQTEGGVSGAGTFEVRAGVPVIAALVNGSVVAGTASHDLQVDGTGFSSTSVVQIDGVSVPTTVQGATRVVAHLDAAALVVPGDYPVRVFTPAPGGGTSNELTLTMQPGVPALGIALRITDSVGQQVTLTGPLTRYFGPWGGPPSSNPWYVELQGWTSWSPTTPVLHAAVMLTGSEFAAPPPVPVLYPIAGDSLHSVMFSFTDGPTTWDADSGTVRLATVAGDTLVADVVAWVRHSAWVGGVTMRVRGRIVATH
jgi:hypothetical protein